MEFKEGRKYDWKERRFQFSDNEFGRRAPEGKVWCVREMCSYHIDIESFVAHLQAMAEGLEQAYFKTYDCDFDSSDDENDGMFVVGLRPMTEDDKTADQIHAEWKESNERAELERLKEKYESG